MAAGGEASSLLPLVECCICLDVMVHPQALQCLHHFCRDCTGKLDRILEDNITGVLCPTCKTFTSETTIQNSYLMNNLIDMYNKKQQKHGGNLDNCDSLDHPDSEQCLQCSSSAVTKFCVNCQIPLCVGCEKGHVRIPVCKGHKLVDINERVAQDEDMGEACPKHPSLIIRYNCVHCDITVCAECKILEHDEHRTELIEDSIERLVEDTKKHAETIKAKSQKYQEKINEAKCFQQKCENNIDKTKKSIEEHALKITSAVEKHSKKLSSEMNAGFVKAWKSANATKSKLDEKLAKQEQLLFEVDSTLNNLRGHKLLKTLKAGLFDDIQTASMDDKDNTSFNLNVPEMVYQLKNQPSDQDIESCMSMLYKTGGKAQLGMAKKSTGAQGHTRLFQDSPTSLTLLANTFTPVSHINIQTPCERFCYFRREIWCPYSRNGFNQINIFNNSLKLIKTLYLDQVNQPKAVSPINKSQVILAAQNGLFVVTTDDVSTKKAVEGNFIDVQSNNDIIVALEETDKKKNKVKIFSNTTELKHQAAFDVTNHPCTSLVLLQTHIWIASYQYSFRKVESYLTKYSFDGKEIDKVGHYGKLNPGDFYRPMVCLADKNGGILVADHWNNRLQVVGPDRTLTVVPNIPNVKRPLDVRITEGLCVYILWYNSNTSENHITKYRIKLPE